MNDNISWTELVHLPIAKMQDVLLARFVGRDEATKLGFTPAILTRVATAISETTRNVVQHAGSPGEIRLARSAHNGRPGLRIIVSDKGRGIVQPERHLQGGSAGSLGSGLDGAQRLTDYFRIESAPGAGTTVTMEIWGRD
jgi:serine/threonine-protein kinase RsbT